VRRIRRDRAGDDRDSEHAAVLDDLRGPGLPPPARARDEVDLGQQLPGCGGGRIDLGEVIGSTNPLSARA
jgi:hypothetical protein